MTANAEYKKITGYKDILRFLLFFFFTFLYYKMSSAILVCLYFCLLYIFAKNDFNTACTALLEWASIDFVSLS